MPSLMDGGKAKGAVAGTRHFVWCIQARSKLCRRESPFSRVVERLVCFATDPEMMKQNR